MSEELFFQNEEEDEIVASWLKDSEEEEQEEEIRKGDRKRSFSQKKSLIDSDKEEIRLGNDARNKFGLGYDAKEAKSTVEEQREQNDALMERIKKRKKLAKEERKKLLDQEQHGVIEEDIGGRYTVPSKGSKPRSDIICVTANKKKAGSSYNVAKKLKTTSALSTSGNSNTADSENVNRGEVNEPANNMKRKRPKTRSKQKNIRRDKRDDAFKPKHLLVGSKNYTGRPLTVETKKVMGLSKS